MIHELLKFLTIAIFFIGTIKFCEYLVKSDKTRKLLISRHYTLYINGGTGVATWGSRRFALRLGRYGRPSIGQVYYLPMSELKKYIKKAEESGLRIVGPMRH